MRGKKAKAIRREIFDMGQATVDKRQYGVLKSNGRTIVCLGARKRYLARKKSPGRVSLVHPLSK